MAAAAVRHHCIPGEPSNAFRHGLAASKLMVAGATTMASRDSTGAGSAPPCSAHIFGGAVSASVSHSCLRPDHMHVLVRTFQSPWHTCEDCSGPHGAEGCCPVHQPCPNSNTMCAGRGSAQGALLHSRRGSVVQVRKLEFLMAKAKQEGRDCVITLGGIQSNHCRATAVAARWAQHWASALPRAEHALNASQTRIDEFPGHPAPLVGGAGGGGGRGSHPLPNFGIQSK